MASSKKLSLGLATLAVALVRATPAAAQPKRPPTYPDFAFGSPTGEALLALGSALSVAAFKLPQRSAGWGPDWVQPYDPSADWISDFTGAYLGSGIAMGVGYGLEVAYFGQQGVSGGGVYAMRAPLIDLEAAGLTTGIVMTLKRLTGRCRPRYYIDGKCLDDSLAEAFPSGHTGPVGAVAGARLMLALQTTAGAEFRWGAFSVAEVLSLGTAYLRVRAGMHSWTDVLGGLVLGHAVGALVAAAHPMRAVDPRDRTVDPVTTGSGTAALSWGGRF